MNRLLARGPVTLPPHLSGAAVAATVDDELAGPEWPRVLTHLSHCSSCRERVDTERATKNRLRVLTVGTPAPSADLRGTLLSLQEIAPAPTMPTGPRASRPPALRPVPAGHPAPPAVRSGAVAVFAAVGLGLVATTAAAFPLAVGAAGSTGVVPAPVAASGSGPDRVPAPGWVPRPGRMLTASLPLAPGASPPLAPGASPPLGSGAEPRPVFVLVLSPSAALRPVRHRSVPLFDRTIPVFGQAAWPALSRAPGPATTILR